MTSLEEIKTAIIERIDAAWSEVKNEVDADKVRTYVQGLTGELLSHVYAVEAELVNHVLGKQDPAPAPAEPGTGDTPPAQVGVPAPSETPAPAEPAQSAPDGSVQAQPTGMATNPPADDAPASADEQPVEAETPEPTQ